MTLPEHQNEEHREEEELLSEENDDDDDDIFGFGSTRTITFRRAKNKLSMISNELRMREKRKRVLQMCLRKLERIKDSENNLRISVIIHNTYSRLTADIKRDKQRGQNRYQQQQQQQHYKESQQTKDQNSPKKVVVERKLDLDNLEELCSIDDNDSCPPIHDPILKNSEEIEQALSRKRKAEVEQAILSYHQLEKRLKSDAFHDVTEGHNDLSMQCNNNNNLLNSFQCGKAAALDSSNGIFQSLVVKSLET